MLNNEDKNIYLDQNPQQLGGYLVDMYDNKQIGSRRQFIEIVEALISNNVSDKVADIIEKCPNNGNCGSECTNRCAG